MYIAQIYSFTPGGGGEGYIEIPSVLKLEDFGTITNVSRGSVLYDPTEGQAGASVSYSEGSTVLTLEQSTTYCSSDDKLQIIVLQDVGAGSGGATETTLLSIDGKIPELVGGKVPVDIGTNIDVSIDNTSIEVSNDVGNPIPISDAGGSITVDGEVEAITGFALPLYDKIELSYTGQNLTGVVYKAGGITVATLTLVYDGSNNLISVTKS